MAENCPEFAARLAQARAQRGEKQQEAARHIGISAATLSVLERRGNVGSARFMDVVAVCRYYGWPVEEVIALCLGEVEAAEEAGVVLLLLGLPPEKREFVARVITAVARGLEEGS